MEWKNIISVICGAVTLVGGVSVAYQIYRMTVIDAEARGLKHPKFWGLFAMSGNNGNGGLILYLIGRRKYPIINMSDAIKSQIESRKKSAGVGLIFIAAGVIGFALCMFII